MKFCHLGNINGLGRYYAKKISQLERNTYCKMTLICGIEKHQTSKSKADSLDTENTLVAARGQGMRGLDVIGERN